MFGMFFTHFIPKAPEPEQPLTVEQQVLKAVESPITKGELSDKIGLTYRQLDPILCRLIGAGQIRVYVDLKNGLACVHYVRRG